MTINNNGAIIDVAKSNQLEDGESQDLCGNYGVATLVYAGLPGKGPRGTAEQIDVLADSLATRFNAGPVAELGSTDQNMYDYMSAVVDPQSGSRAMHYWVIPSDEQSIKTALNAGYPVLLSANETNIRSVKSGERPPYPWKLSAGHILPIIGISKSGNYIVADYLNNSFQGEWPCEYDASVLQPDWAAVIQLVGPDPNNPWLDPIPSADPKTWPSNYNAQLFASASLLPDRQLSIKEVVGIAKQVGFTGDGLVTIVSIAMAESSLHSHPKDNINSDADKTRDRGILQFNSKWHIELSDADCYDPITSFTAGYRVSKQGTDFGQWSTFTNGAYLTHVADVQNVVNPPWQKQAYDVWNGSPTKSIVGTGIFNHWLAMYSSLNVGPPTTDEIHTVNWANEGCIIQFFSAYRIELVNNVYTLYGPNVSRRL